MCFSGRSTFPITAFTRTWLARVQKPCFHIKLGYSLLGIPWRLELIEQEPSLRLYAAVVYALGLARAQLYDVKFGDFSKDDVERVLHGTSQENIAVALGLREDDIAIDYEEALTKQERDSIQGYRDRHQT